MGFRQKTCFMSYCFKIGIEFALAVMTNNFMYK